MMSPRISRTSKTDVVTPVPVDVDPSFGFPAGGTPQIHPEGKWAALYEKYAERGGVSYEPRRKTKACTVCGNPAGHDAEGDMCDSCIVAAKPVSLDDASGAQIAKAVLGRVLKSLPRKS